jgi:dihydroneopterin triphosphate diphosphatase
MHHERALLNSAVFMSKPYKIPQSTLVVIYTLGLQVLLIRRADTPGEEFWQSVTGSKDCSDESFAQTAAREVQEETGISCGPHTSLGAHLQDWCLENVYPIYPRWLHRYPAGVSHNTERVFGLMVPDGTPVTLNPQEHTQFQWLPHQQAAQACFSPSNAEACLLLPRFVSSLSAFEGSRAWP